MSNKVLFFFILVFTVFIMNSCDSDDEMQPDPPVIPEDVFRIFSFHLMEANEILETTTIYYDDNDRVDYLLVQNEMGQSTDSVAWSYDGTLTTCRFHDLIEDYTKLILTITTDANGNMTNNSMVSYNEMATPTKRTDQIFDYSNNVLTDYLYQTDFEADGVFDRTNDGHINWDGDQLQSIVTHTFSSSINYIDSTLYEYEGGLISLTRNLNSSNGGAYEMTLQTAPMYENNFFTSAFIQEFFTDETGFTYPVSEATIDFYKYNENELLSKEFIGDREVIFNYEMAPGNFGDGYFYRIGETTHMAVLGVVPVVE